jgi:hypothetical protein
VVVPLVDPEHYKRVRYWIFDHFVGFRYGEDFYVVNSMFIMDVPDGEPHDARACMQRAEKWGRPQLKSFQVKVGAFTEEEQEWRGQAVLVRSVDGHVDFGLKRREFSGAYAVYPAYPRACLLFGMAVPWGEHGVLASKVRDRWVREGVRRVRPRTETRPYRLED